MEPKKTKIALYVKRTFGEKLNATFDFIKENWKILLKLTTFLLLPLCLIQALSMNGLLDSLLAITMNPETLATNPLAIIDTTFFLNYGVTLLCSIVGGSLLSALVYALMKTYHEREERLVGVTLSSIRPLLLNHVKRILLLILLGMVLSVVLVLIVVLLAVLTPFTLLLTIPLMIALVIPLVLLTPVYLFEKRSIIGSFKDTYRLGFATWGGILLFCIILNLIAGVLQGITMMPWYIATLVKYFFAMSDGGDVTTISPIYSFFLYVLGIIQTFGAYLSMIIFCVGIAYQYGHASEVVDSISVEEEIDNFDQLK